MNAEPAGGREGYDRMEMQIAAEARRLREEAEAHPLRLPVRRRIDERHHLLSGDGLGVWFTIQLSPHSLIYDAIFERADRPPSDEECGAWLEHLVAGRTAVEAPGLPGSHTRRFEAFEHAPEVEAPLA